MTELKLKLDKGDELKVTSATNSINYIRIGNGTMNRTSGVTSIDIIDLMVNMSKAELKTIKLLIDNVPWEFDSIDNKYFTLGIVYMPSSTFKSDAEQKSFQRGIKGLKTKDLVRKSGRNNYMLNPLAVIPTNVGEANRIWKDLTQDTPHN